MCTVSRTRDVGARSIGAMGSSSSVQCRYDGLRTAATVSRQQTRAVWTNLYTRINDLDPLSWKNRKAVNKSGSPRLALGTRVIHDWHLHIMSRRWETTQTVAYVQNLRSPGHFLCCKVPAGLHVKARLVLKRREKILKHDLACVYS
jgi:hypothetical protein